MLSKKERVPRALFSKASRGKDAKKPESSEFFTLRTSKDESVSVSRFSFVVSGKVSKKATERNTLRRRGYAVIEKEKKNVAPGFICIFFVKKSAAALSFERFATEANALLSKAGVFKKTTQ